MLRHVNRGGSRFVFELVIWPQEVTLLRWTQPSGPLCLWQCLILMPIRCIITEYWSFFGLLFQNSQNRLRMTLKEGNGFNPAKGEPMMWNVWNTWSLFGLVCAGGQERLEIVSQEVNILLRQHFPAAEGDKTRQIFSSVWNFLSPTSPWPCIPFESISFLPGSVWDWQDWYYGISTDCGHLFFRQNESWF